MVIVAIIQGTKKLQEYLKKLPVSIGDKNGFLLLGMSNHSERKLLEKRGFSEIILPNFRDNLRNRFLQEYIDLIGIIGKEYNTRKWWATDIASKNRFTSKLPFLLHQFLTAVEAIQNEEFDHLIILNPPWVILSSLKKFLKKEKMRFVCLEEHYIKWKDFGFGWCRKILLAVYNAIIILKKKYYAQNKLRHVIKKSLSQSKTYYVIKTFIYDHSFSENGVYRDVFFGSLLDYLKDKRQVLIYANILGDYENCIHKMSQCPSHAILPIEALLSSMDIIEALVRFLFCKIRIKREAFFLGYEVSDIINNELFRTYNGIDLYQFLHYWSTKRLIRTLPVETFLLTYENNPWEKMCIMAIRDYSPNTIIVGYQHTVVPQASANMFVSEKEKDVIPIPNLILTVGEAPKEIIKRYGSYEKGKIKPSCGLRFEYLFHMPISERKRSGHILVVLEGIFEVYKMVNYVLRELKENSQYQVRIRTHPVLPIANFQHKLTSHLNGVSNFMVSSNTLLKDDIDWADMILYWGSTVALEALSMGKPIIHYEMDSILSYDPLFECRHLKWVLSEKEHLIPIIEEIYSCSNDRFDEEQMKAKEYLNRYFFPVTEDGLKIFLMESWNKLHF